jgi:hypothetical protein
LFSIHASHAGSSIDQLSRASRAPPMRRHCPPGKDAKHGAAGTIATAARRDHQ